MQGQNVILASDHAGCEAKQQIAQYLQKKGYHVFDYGVHDATVSVDYPKQAHLLAKGIYNHEANLGFLFCGTGIGMSIAINRYPFLRGALICNEEMAKMARAHNNANVLIFGGRTMPVEEIKKCIDAFMNTEFEGGRHQVRVNQLGGMPYDL